jgi:hypothetical protein
MWQNGWGGMEIILSPERWPRGLHCGTMGNLFTVPNIPQNHRGFNAGYLFYFRISPVKTICFPQTPTDPRQTSLTQPRCSLRIFVNEESTQKGYHLQIETQLDSNIQFPMSSKPRTIPPMPMLLGCNWYMPPCLEMPQSRSSRLSSRVSPNTHSYPLSTLLNLQTPIYILLTNNH